MFEVLDWRDGETGETKFVIGKRGGRGKLVYNLFTQEMRDLEIGERIPGDFIVKLPWSIAPGILRALSTWLNNKGIRPDEESIIKGKLEATKYHLEDLRKLLDLDDRNRPDLATIAPKDHSTEVG